PQAMQKRDQPGAAVVDEAEFLLDPGAHLARRTRQGRLDPRLQGLGLLQAQLAGTAAHVEAGQAVEPALFEQLVPAADRVVIEQQNPGHLLAAHAIVQQHQSVGAPRHPTGRQAIASQRDQRPPILFLQKAATNHAPIRIRTPSKSKLFPDFSMSQGIAVSAGYYFGFRPAAVSTNVEAAQLSVVVLPFANLSGDPS